MIPRAKDLRKLWFEWPEALYGRFNFQRDEHIDAFMGLLVDNGLPAVIVLGGDPGIGRGFLCDAAAQRARDQGHKVAVWHLDLDGFEPDVQNPLTHYLRHLIDQEERQREAAREKAKGVVKSAAKTLIKIDLLGQASEVAASLLSLLWQFEDPLQRFADLLSRSPRASGAPARDDPDTLRRFLTELTRDRKLLVHVNDGLQLTGNLRRWLIREAERAPERLLLVVSCPLGQAIERAAPEARSKPERFDVHPLETVELRDLLDRRFEPNEFLDDLVAVLMRRCHGRPAAIANQVADLMEADLLLYENETWRLPPHGLEDDRLVDAFSRGLFEEVDKPLAILAEEEPELAHALRELLSLTALCGPYVPMTALIEHLKLDKATDDAVIDWIDDVLVGELSWLIDLGFHVSGFHGHNVYAFTHPLLPRVVLDQESRVARELRAASLLQFLKQQVPVASRSWARCFLSIAENLGDREREPYERSLAWWISLESADALQAEVREEIEREEIDPELVWRVAFDSEPWPAYRRLAVLEAYAKATVGEGEAAIAVLPFNRLADFHLLRARLLIVNIGQYAEGLADALNALKLVYRDPLKQTQALNLSGVARRELGDIRGAKADLEAAFRLGIENLGEEHPATLAAMGHLATTLRALGDLAGAMELHERALEIEERVLGNAHPNTLTMRNNLATALMALEEFVAAKDLLEQNLEAQEHVLGAEHPGTLMSKSNLAEALHALGDLASARKLKEQVLEIQERLLGAEHPDTLTSRHNLAATLFALGDLVGARKLQEQTLEIQERVLGVEHASTTLSSASLLLTVQNLNDSNTEAHLIEKLRWLLNRDENSIPSADQRIIRLWLLELLNPSSPLARPPARPPTSPTPPRSSASPPAPPPPSSSPAPPADSAAPAPPPAAPHPPADTAPS